MMMLLYMNPSAPPFDDKRVRQAIAWAFDPEGYGISTFFGRGEPITGPIIPKVFLGYDPAGMPVGFALVNDAYGYGSDPINLSFGYEPQKGEVIGLAGSSLEG